MENKKLLLAMLMILSLCLSVFAKGKSAKKTEIVEKQTETAEEENVIQWQTLEWEEEDPDYVTKYQIVIEKYDDEKEAYIPFETVETKDNTTSINIEPQLEAGIYRYKIVTYDLFYMPSVESKWNSLVIHKAYTPKVSGISSDATLSNVIYLEEYNDGIFNITGQNLFLPPEDFESTSYTKYLLKNIKDLKNQKTYDESKASYVPEILEHEENGKKMKVYFDPAKLEVGEYYFTAEDASGLTSQNGNENKITIRFKKRVDLDVSAGYEFPYVLYDSTINDYFNCNYWPLSANAKITFIPLKFRLGFFGLQLEGNYSRLGVQYDTYSIDGNLITGDLNFVYQFPIYVKVSKTQRKHIITLEAHGGVGLTYFDNFVFHFENDINSDPLNSLNLNADAGVAFQFYFTNRIYAEIQADFIHSFISDMTLGTIVPSLSVGWQF